MPTYDLNALTIVNVTRAELQALIAGNTVVAERKYRITDAVSGADSVIVVGQSTNTISLYAINEGITNAWGVYDITSDIFSPQLDGNTGVETVTGGVVDNTDPANPIINADPSGAAATAQSAANSYTDTAINDLQVTITRAALQALIAGGTVVPERRYRINDAVGSTKVIIVRGKTTNTISSYAENETDNEYVKYDITANTIINYDLEHVTDLGATTSNNVTLSGTDKILTVIDPGTTGQAELKTVTSKGGVLILTNEAGFSATFTPDMMTSSNTYRLPTGGSIFITSINGQNADDISGNITVPAPYTHGSVNGYPHTGNTTNTVMGFVLIPANTLGINDSVDIASLLSKSGTAAAATHRLYFDTVLPVVGAAVAGTATLIGTSANFAATGVYNKFGRTIINQNSQSNNIVFNTSGTAQVDYMNSAAANTFPAIDFANDVYIITASQLSSAADTVTLRQLRCTTYKQ
jgi:hypothetical protein